MDCLSDIEKIITVLCMGFTCTMIIRFIYNRCCYYIEDRQREKERLTVVNHRVDIWETKTCDNITKIQEIEKRLDAIISIKDKVKYGKVTKK